MIDIKDYEKAHEFLFRTINFQGFPLGTAICQYNMLANIHSFQKSCVYCMCYGHSNAEKLEIPE